jgi:hypothetical protein
VPKKNPRRNISRIERVNASGKVIGGWEVRMQRQRESYCKLFSDSIYGGKLAALRAAKEYRDNIDAQSRKMTVADKSLTPSDRNRSGIVGVRQHQQIDRRGDYEYHYWYWVAQWTDGHGRRRTKSFAVEKWGDAEAFRLAWAAREEGVRKAKR